MSKLPKGTIAAAIKEALKLLGDNPFLRGTEFNPAPDHEMLLNQLRHLAAVQSNAPSQVAQLVYQQKELRQMLADREDRIRELEEQVGAVETERTHWADETGMDRSEEPRKRVIMGAG